METDAPSRQSGRLDLPPNFTFSQSSLQAYVDCPRRFWLAYVQQLPWPAVEAAPVQAHEEHMRLGATFHRLVERAEIGMDVEQISAGLTPPLATWFDAYLRYRPADLPQDLVEIERVLSIPYGEGDNGLRLAAKYDLIAVDHGGRVVIMDWKTTRGRGDPGRLRHRLQSTVYPYVLVEAGRRLGWGPISPEQVEMRYWFTAAPSQPIVFRYDSAQHEACRTQLFQLLEQILAARQEEDFPKVTDTDINRRRFCNFCVYRSRCNRGTTPGDAAVFEDEDGPAWHENDDALAFSLDDVDELTF